MFVYKPNTQPNRLLPEARGRRELPMILAQLSAGISIEQVLAHYEPEPAHGEDEYATEITMHEYASDWLESRRVGEIGEGPLAESTCEDHLCGSRSRSS